MIAQIAAETLLRSVVERLRASGIDNAQTEARRLLNAAGVSSESLLAYPERTVDRSLLRRIEDALEQRISGKPIGRIFGQRDFYGRTFELADATLEPRADSETLIDAVLSLVHAQGMGQAGLRFIDVGTGTGCLLITLLCELPRAVGLGIDLAPEALEMASRNARQLGVEDRSRWQRSNALSDVDETFDILIANPPYIRTDELASLDVAVRDFDPALALDGGADGLDVYHAIARDLDRVVPRGIVAFEIAAGDVSRVTRAIDAGFSGNGRWHVWHDLSGYARCVAKGTLDVH